MDRILLALSPLALLALAPAVMASDSVKATEVAVKKAPDAQFFDGFGWTVAVGPEGDLAVAGSPHDDFGSKSEAGSVYVFRRDGTTWPFEAKLKSPDPQNGARFGSSVATDGARIVVGAPGHASGGSASGAAFVFTHDGANWQLEADLADPDGTTFDSFGRDVALSGDRLVAAAPSGPPGGTVHVFVRNAGTWTREAELDQFANSGYVFGVSVSLDGDRLIVGAPHGVQAQPGRAFVFERVGSAWTQTAELVSSDPELDPTFGTAVAQESGTIAVGASGLLVSGPQRSGAVYLFAEQAGVWTEEQQLVGSTGALRDAFGYSIAIERGALVVGAQDDPTVGLFGGAAYVFVDDGTTWTEELQLLPAEASSYGFDVALAADRLIVGKPGDSSRGAISIYDLRFRARIYCTAKSNSCGARPAIGFSGVPSATASSGFEIRAMGAKAGKAGVLLYSDAGPAALPFQGGLLCVNPMPLKRAVPVTDTNGTPGMCDGTLALDMNAFAAGALGGNPLPSLSLPGTQVQCQYIARDTLANGPLLTEAVEYVICD